MGFHKIPDKAKTKKVCRAAIKQNLNYIESIPEDVLIPEILMCCKKSRYPNAKILDNLLAKMQKHLWTQI